MSDALGGIWGDSPAAQASDERPAADALASAVPIAKGQTAAFFMDEPEPRPQDEEEQVPPINPFVRLPEKR